MSETLSHTPTLRTIDATRPSFQLPVSMTEMWIGVGGCAVAGALGWALGVYLMLPFGATG